MVMTLAKRGPQTVSEWIVFGCFVAGVIALIAVASWLDRRRCRRIVDSLTRRGFAAATVDGLTFPVGFPDVLDNPLLLPNSQKVRWTASGTDRGRPMHLLEHQYTWGSGKSTQTVVHLIAATPLPTGLPPVTVERKRLLRTHNAAQKPIELKLEDPEFTKNCVIYGDETAALALLSPSLQALAAVLGKSQWIRFDGQTLQVGERTTPKEATVDRLLALLDAVVTALPPEARALAAA
jgi:hypothetical protein